MQTAEAEGPTIDEAISRALELLGVERDAAEVEIIRNASKGILGIGGTPARVRASLRRALAIDEQPGAKQPTAESGDDGESSATKNHRRGAPEPRHDDDEGPDPESVAKAQVVLQEILQRMGVASEAVVEPGEKGPQLNLVGDSSGILIGRQGQTLDAIEYLVNRIVAREEDSRRRITVDTEGYRARRRTALEQLAKKTAAKARESGRSITLDPMSPRDRRVVHLALQGDPGLGTRSTGEGYYKQVVLVPRRGGGRRN